MCIRRQVQAGRGRASHLEKAGESWRKLEPAGASPAGAGWSQFSWSQVEPGGARWSQVEPGGARWSQVEPGGAR
eukprot:14698429-Alexandrium_andersonii.AAC.1